MNDEVENPTDDRSWLSALRRIVVKVGSRALVDETNQLDENRVAALVAQIAALRAHDREIVLVSSGAIAAGLGDLNLKKRPKDLPSLQAAAACGQARLIELYRELFKASGFAVGQVLLTHDDMQARDRHLNARNTIRRLLDAGAIPIVNENDTVAVDEIRVGDNDRLAALVSTLADAELVILLTMVDGLLTAPTEDGGRLIGRVTEMTDAVRNLARGKGSDIAVGGMEAKLEAAAMCMRAGEPLIIANAHEPDVLARLLAGEPLGTLFASTRAAGEDRLAHRKRWIALFHKPAGEIEIDEGAVTALRESGRSLLPIGCVKVSGDFNMGDPVRILDSNGQEIARGFTNYSSDDVAKIAGKRTTDIATILGTCAYEEIVHRDNLVVV